MFFVSKKKFNCVLEDLAKADRRNVRLSEENAKLAKELEIAKSTVYAPVVGITETELANYKAALKDALEAAHKRQKSANAKPSDFMKGLELAIKTLDEYPVHELV